MGGSRFIKRHDVPNDAESLTLFNYVDNPVRESKFIPGLLVRDVNKFNCPKCKTRNPEPRHGEVGECSNCNLLWAVFGTALLIWIPRRRR